MSRTFPDISGRSDVPAGTITILGNVELFCGDKQADLRRQLRKALALMVAARGRRVRRQEIAAAVWGDEERDVRTLMWSLRRALRDCDSGFDVPPDKGKDGNYLLDVAEPGTLEEAVDAFRLQDQAGGLPPAAASEVLNECRWALYDYDPPAKTIRLSERLERESLLARSPYFQSEALMTLAIDQLRLGQVTDARSTLLAHERTRPANHASQWLQLTMETVLDLWHGRFDAAEARLFTVAAPIVARAHAEQARVADTLQQTWQGQVFWLRREQGQVLSQTDPEVFRQVEGHAFFAIWRVGLAPASYDAGDLPGAAGHVRALDEDYQGFDAFPPHGWTVSVAALLAELCLAMSPAGRPSAAGDPPGGLPPGIAGRLRVILSRYAGEFVLAGWPSVLLGPAERFSGLLATATGDYEEALHLFDAVADKVAGAPPQAARLQVNRARALILLARSRGGQAGPAAAARLLTGAGATADRLGMRALAREASELLSEC